MPYVCQSCGSEQPKLTGKCRACGEWGTLTEFTPQKEVKGKNAVINHSWTGQKAKPIPLSQVDGLNISFIKTGIEEFDRVLGGGVVRASAVLLTGDPGAGKSTILTQVCKNVGENYKVLYVSAEETNSHIKERAVRLGVDFNRVKDNIIVYAENNLENILSTIQEIAPDLVIIDSIQAIYSSELTAVAGGVSQVQSCALALNRQCKQMGHGLLIIGHVTKDGTAAGPNTFKHIIDAVLKFEVEGTTDYRSITSEKNRFAQLETGFFNMTEKGLESVANPVSIFLEEESRHGSSIYVMRKGNRNVLVEIQALAEQKMLNSPKRVANGLDINRLHILLALVGNRLFNSVKVSEFDIYMGVLQGAVSKEQDADLPMVLSILSALTGRVLPDDLASFGEVTLNGGFRGVKFAESRVRDAFHFRFKQFIIPFQNRTDELDSFARDNDITIHYVKRIEDIESIFNRITSQALDDL